MTDLFSQMNAGLWSYNAPHIIILPSAAKMPGGLIWWVFFPGAYVVGHNKCIKKLLKAMFPWWLAIRVF